MKLINLRKNFNSKMDRRTDIFPKKTYIQMPNRHTKMCSLALIREMEYHLTPVSTAVIKKTSSKC